MKAQRLKFALPALCMLGLSLAPLRASHATQYDVQFVGCTDAGTCYIGINPPLVGPMPAGCTSRDQVRFYLSGSAGQNFHTLALSAFMSGYKLDVTHHQLASTCIDGFARVWYMGPVK